MTPYFQDSAVTIYHGDCREVVPALGRFDLLLTDPPYGIGMASTVRRNQARVGMVPKDWDREPPAIETFKLLVGAADKHCIWGGNYFPLPLSRGWLAWCKPDAVPTMANVELAWTSEDANCRYLLHSIAATNPERLGHPTQKPLRVIKWSLGFFPEAQTILDPFGGSGTTGRAAKDLGRKCVLIESDESYCEMAARRMGQEVLDL